METNKINYITIQQYLDGTLSKEAMHELEKQALDDPFLADAIEGYSHINKPAAKHLSLLQTQLEDRIANLQEDKNRFNFSWQRLSIAAAAALLFVTSSILLWIKTGNQGEYLAQQPKQVDVTLVPQDSISAIISSEKKALSTAFEKPEPAVKSERAEVEIASLSASKKQATSEVAAGPNSNNDLVSLRATETKQDFAMRSKVLGSSTRSLPAVSGKVVSESGEPIAGASVKLTSSGITTATNEKGEFKLNDSVGGDLRVAYLGFASKTAKVEAGMPVTVQLNPDPAPLNEIAVVGYREQKKLNETPEPVMGLTKYQEYLESNLALKAKGASGEIVLTFNVAENGDLSNFKVEKGLNDALNEEAIRLIKQGPAWKAGKTTAARLSVVLK